jgi:hypothetical protein
MKLKLISLIFVSISFLFTGCLRTYYPAIYQTSSLPMIYETADTTNKLSNYFGADVTISKGDYNNESIQLFKGSYTFVDTKDYFNVNPTIFGYGGNYKVSGLNEYDGNKTVFGLGGQFSTSVNIKIKSLKIGLGLSAGVVGEFGGYYNFRIKADSEGKIESEQKLITFIFSTFPVISYEFSNSIILSTQANLGVPGLLSPSLVLNNNGYVYWLSWIPDNFNRNNIFGHRLVIGFMINIKNL